MKMRTRYILYFSALALIVVGVFVSFLIFGVVRDSETYFTALVLSVEDDTVTALVTKDEASPFTRHKLKSLVAFDLSYMGEEDNVKPGDVVHGGYFKETIDGYRVKMAYVDILFSAPLRDAETTDDAQSAELPTDEAAACAAAEQYLKNWSYNCYMYAENDLTAGTILDSSLSENEILAAAVLVLGENASADLSMDTLGQEIVATANRLTNNMQFMIDKARFFAEKGKLSDSGALQDFSLAYYVQAVNIADSVATVEINEGIGWQYPELDVPSSSYEEHTVQLAKINGEWFVIDVETAYDWFHQRYKHADYDIDALIAEERADFQAQKEYAKEYQGRTEN